jgi:hypothetical protein
MSGTALLLLLVGLALIYLLRLRARLALLAEQVRQLRANALEPISYRPAPKDALGDTVTKVTEEAERLGFHVLGDYLEDSALDATGRPMRWIVDAEGTVFGWLAPFEVSGQQHIVAVLMSHELDRQTLTSRQPPASLLSRPPFVDMQSVPTHVSLTELVSRHRKRAELDNNDRAFVPVKTFDQLTAELDRMRSKTAAWRKAQPADELLEADLRSLLGAQYAKLAGPLRRRLR